MHTSAAHVRVQPFLERVAAPLSGLKRVAECLLAEGRLRRARSLSLVQGSSCPWYIVGVAYLLVTLSHYLLYILMYQKIESREWCFKFNNTASCTARHYFLSSMYMIMYILIET